MSTASGHHGPVDIDDDINNLTAWLFWASALALTFVACAKFCNVGGFCGNKKIN
jgi:hypothetical protein